MKNENVKHTPGLVKVYFYDLDGRRELGSFKPVGCRNAREIRLEEAEATPELLAALEMAEKIERLEAEKKELLNQCHHALRQMEQVYTKGDPKTEGLCLSIRGLRAALKKAKGE